MGGFGLTGLSAFASSLWAGDPNVALPGSGTSQPTGLEARLEYNGIILHDRQVVDGYFINSIDGLGGPDIRDNREPNPQSHGETSFDSYLGGRTILLSGEVQAGNIGKLRDLQQALRTAFYVFQEEDLILRTGDINRDVFISCKMIDKIAMKEEQTSLQARRKFQITLRASDPRFKSLIERSSTAMFGSTSGAQSRQAFMRVANAGNFLASPSIRIYGPMTNTVITNDTLVDDEPAARFIKINGDIPAGRYYEYKVVGGDSATLYDDLGANKLGQLDIASSTIQLAPGENQFSLTATAASGSTTGVRITYNDTWV